MIEFLPGSGGSNLGIRVDGRVTTKDFEALADLLEEAIVKHGKIRTLVQVDRLGLVEPGAFWRDLKFSLLHAKDIERLALVGDASWQEPYLKIVGPLVPCETRHFGTSELDAAWSWLVAETESPSEA